MAGTRGSGLAPTQQARTTGVPPLLERITHASEVARRHAGEVDACERAPHEAIAALRAARLLGAGPTEDTCRWEGRQLLTAASALGAACSSTGLIWAMHQGQMQTLAEHAQDTPGLREFVEAAWDEQPLVASVTSERGAADPRQGNACCESTAQEGRVRISKPASAASYLRVADAALLSARRSESAPPSDQVLVLARKADMRITFPGAWKALGMRGTMSEPADVECVIARTHIFAEPFSRLSSVTMNPATHLTWGGCWLGIARETVKKARQFLRAKVRSDGDELTTLKSVRLGELRRTLLAAETTLHSFADSYDRRKPRQADGFATADLPLASNYLRLTVSELTVQVVLGALELIGIDAYRGEAVSALSIERQVRDILSSVVMIGGDRLRLADAYLALYAAEGAGRG